MMQNRRFAPLALALALGVGGCGGRSVARSDGARGADAQVMPDTMPLRADGRALPDQGVKVDAAPVGACLIAARFESCCTVAEAAGESQVAADPCLVPWDRRYERPAACPLPDVCHSAGVCREAVPLTRVVGPDPVGHCVFLSECGTAGDCVLAVDQRPCCACPTAYPRLQVFNDPCLVALSNWEDGDECSDRCAADVMCEECPPLPETITCVGAGPQLEAELKACWAGIPPP
jgi:hypothetical protein